MLGQTGTYIIGILLFAVATVILFMIGEKRKVNQDKRLENMLLNNGAYRVRKYLKSHDYITLEGIGYVIQNIKAKEFSSSKTAIIKDGAAFQKLLLDYMLDNGYLVEAGEASGVKGRDKRYRLPD